MPQSELSTGGATAPGAPNGALKIEADVDLQGPNNLDERNCYKMGLFGGGDEEAARLLGGKEKNYGSYAESNGENPARIKRMLDDDEKPVPKIPISALFRYATSRDKWILGIGTIFAVIHGAGFPLLALVFGNMTDTFIKQFVFGFVNGTTPSSSLETERSDFNATPTHRPDITTTISTSTSTETFHGFPKALFGQLMNDFTICYIAVGVIVLISAFIQAVCWEWSCERQAYRLRQEFFYQVLRKEISWFDHQQTGDLAIKLSDDLERIREGIGHKFSMVIQFVSTFVMGIVIGFLTSWQLTLVILSITPLLAGTTAFSGKLIATQSVREQQKYGKAGGVAEEVLSGIRTVASFGGEKREIQRYSLALSAGLRMAIKKYQVFALAIGLVFFIMYGSYSLAFWYGCQLLDQRLLSPGDVFTVFFSVLLGAFSLGNAIPFISTIASAQGCGAVVFNIIDTLPKIDAYSNEGIIPDKLTGHIQFRNVCFRYPSRKSVPILTDFNLDIEAGKIVAIVGMSGTGKSTLLNLVLRFYDPDLGSILIDGNDLKALNLAWFRHHIGYVAQEPVLYGMTIYENIRYGRDDVRSEQIIQAARLAYAHDFISSLPQGYHTFIGERGSQLSGGQKQRIAIARALVRDPKLLILDESTSALDSKSEAIVQVTLERAAKGRTTLIIAHRLSTIKDADIIHVIKDGQVIESGTHYQLMGAEGMYQDLVLAQTCAKHSEDDGSSASGEESMAGDESTKELNLLLATNRLGLNNYAYPTARRKQKKHIRRKRTVLPDPERDRLIKEADEMNISPPSIKKILRANKPEWFYLCMGAVGCVLTGVIMPVFAYFYSQMFITFSETGKKLLDGAVYWSLMFLALAALSFIGFWIRTIFVSTAGEYLTMRLRLQSFASAVRQPIGWFDQDCNSPSRLSTRLARDAPLVKAAAGHRLSIAVSSFVTTTCAIIIAFYFGWRLALVVLAGFPILMFSGYLHVQVQKSGQKKDAVLMEDAGRVANEAIANIRTVQSLGQERIFCEKYFELLYPMYIEAHRQGLYYGIAFAVSEAVIFLIYAGAFRYGAYLIEIGLMGPTSVYRVFFSIAFCAVSVGQATSWIPDCTKAKLAAGLIFNLIEKQSNIDPFNEGGLRPVLKGHIHFKDVHFRYPSRPNVPVLRSITFQIQPGQTVALVGPSGCGKSTIVSLLERFYDVIGGHVMVDGYDVRSLNIQHLRAHIGVVTQEPVIFDCTIRENIAYGFGDGSTPVPENLIIEASRCANIHNFIISLPNGYDTMVGQRGAQLSGGQKQRLAIARALIRDPKILLLDELDALDTENERLVKDALDKASKGRTTLMIAHRLSSVQNADYIAVLDRGKILEIGTHDELKNAKGMYYKLTKNQQIFH